MFRPAFSAVCDACAATTMWVKANRVGESSDGIPVAEKGYKCCQCEAFETKVLDTRGTIHRRA